MCFEITDNRHTFSCCEVKDGKQLALDLGGDFNQLTTSVQVLVTGNHLEGQMTQGCWKSVRGGGAERKRKLL